MKFSVIGRVARCTILGGVALAVAGLAGCAEVEVGAQAIKSVSRSNTPETQGRVQPTEPPVKHAVLSGPIDPGLTAAPERFEATGVANWDGRGTLRGIWIAHPRATDSQRVRIINPATGLAADGALFRRDKRLAGPEMLISSEAAEAIGIEPGQAAEIVIVGLKPFPKEALAAAPASPQGIPLKPGEGAVQVAEAKPVAPPTQQRVGSEANKRAPTRVPPAAEQAAQQAVRPARRTTGTTAVAAAPAPAPAPSTSQVAPQPTTERDRRLEAELTAELENAQFVVARDGQAPAQTRRTVQRAALATPQPPAQPAVASPGISTAPISDGRNFIQTGVFRVATNASGLVERLRAAGLPAREKSLFTQDGRRLIRVLAGPFDTYRDRSVALKQIQGMGVHDALATRL